MVQTVLGPNITNIIVEFAWNVPRKECNLWEELDMLIEFRASVPRCLLRIGIHWRGHRYGECMNPWYAGMPYTPLCFLSLFPPFVQQTPNLVRYIPLCGFRQLGTYRGVVQRHLDQFLKGDPMGWNKLLLFLWSVSPPYMELSHDWPPLNLFEAVQGQLDGAELLPLNFELPWLCV